MISDQFQDWDVASYEVFDQKIVDEIDHYYDLVRTSDIIISQPIHDRYRDRDDLSLSWVRAAAKPNTRLVVFPSMHFDGQLVGWRSASIPGYRMDYHDMLLFHFAMIGLSADRINGILLDEDLYSEAFISHEIALSIAEMQRREVVDQIDVPISPFLQEFGRKAQLFHIINHPYRAPLAYMANAILRHLGYAANISAAGPEYLPFPHVPSPPSVVRFFSRQNACPEGWWIEDGHRFHLPNLRYTRAEYQIRAVAHLRRYPREELMECLNGHHVKGFLSRLAASSPALPGIDLWRS